MHLESISDHYLNIHPQFGPHHIYQKLFTSKAFPDVLTSPISYPERLSVLMPGSDDGVFLNTYVFRTRRPNSCDSASGTPSLDSDRSSFFLLPWTQECHFHWAQETWTRNNKIVCFYSNLPRPICCADQSGAQLL